MARDGSLPAWFGHVHQRYVTPANSIVAMGVIGGVLAASGAFVWLAVMSSLARLIVYLTCIATLPKLRSLSPQPRGVAARAMGLIMPLLAAGLCLWAASQAKLDAWAFIAGFAVLGTLLYAFSRWRRRKPSPI
jgi:amino acid transporter